jgi:DNA polymerase III delta prime subunit
MSISQEIWALKYRPNTLKDFVFHSSEMKKQIVDIVQHQKKVHLLLYGVPGTGKSTLAGILAKYFTLQGEESEPTDILRINASDDNSIDTVRTLIRNHVSTIALSSNKVVILEEADYLTHSAQAALKDYFESTNAIFILTCNNVTKIDPAIQSRCYKVEFKQPSKKQLFKRLKSIVESEQIEYQDEVLYEYIEHYYPDIRSMINALQAASYTSPLPHPGSKVKSGPIEQLCKCVETNNYNMDLINQEIIPAIDRADFDDVIFTSLYQAVLNNRKVFNDQRLDTAIMTIANHMDMMTRSPVKQITCASLIHSLKMIYDQYLEEKHGSRKN